MLLQKERSLHLQWALIGTLANLIMVCCIVLIPGLRYRFFVLVTVAIFSSQVLKSCNLGIRIEPIVSHVDEFSDVTQLEMLEGYYAGMLKPLDKPEIESIKLSELPLGHYLFQGDNRSENRTRVLSAFLVRYPNAIALDMNEQGSVNILTANIGERKTTGINADPLFMLVDKFDKSMNGLETINIYVLSTNHEDEPINYRIVNSAYAQRINAASTIVFGFYDLKAGKLLPIIA